MSVDNPTPSALTGERLDELLTDLWRDLTGGRIKAPSEEEYLGKAKTAILAAVAAERAAARTEALQDASSKLSEAYGINSTEVALIGELQATEGQR